MDDVIGLSEPQCTWIRSWIGASPPCVVIEHGVPPLASGDYAAIYEKKLEAKKNLSLPTGRALLLSAGLLRDGKGLETIVRAMPSLARANPNVTLVVAGSTHPTYFQATGLRYDAVLRQLADQLHIGAEQLIIRHHYLEDATLERYMLAADLYAAPYAYLGQSSSGMIPLAMSAGCVAVASAFVHATSLLKDGRGVVTPVNHPSFVSLAIAEALSNHSHFRWMVEQAVARSQRFTWPQVGRAYLKLLQSSANRSAAGAGRVGSAASPVTSRIADVGERGYLFQIGASALSGTTQDPAVHLNPLLGGSLLTMSPSPFIFSGCFCTLQVVDMTGAAGLPGVISHRLGSAIASVEMDEARDELTITDQLKVSFGTLRGESVLVEINNTFSLVDAAAAAQAQMRYGVAPSIELRTKVGVADGFRHRYIVTVERLTVGFEPLSRSQADEPTSFHERNKISYGVAGAGEALAPDSDQVTLIRQLPKLWKKDGTKLWKKDGKGKWKRIQHDAEQVASRLPLQREQGKDVVRLDIHTTKSAHVHDSLTWLPDTSRSWFNHSELVVQYSDRGDVKYVRIDYHAREKKRGTIRYPRQENPVTIVNRFAAEVM